MTFTQPNTAPSPEADREFTDAELQHQPLGYWTGAASEAIVGHIRAALRRAGGLSQPQWWVVNRVRDATGGATAAEVIETIAAGRPYVDVSGLRAEIDDLLTRGLLRADADRRLRLTEEGAALVEHLWREVMPATLGQVREGIGDAEYAAVIRLLRRMIRNVGGDASFRL
ncbi:winged helix-turn-helix transcriptional regulator [Streptomyces sp. JJ66]|uniref:MarR family winged helix-turn-helix transcriptional regulator n=1 Tax=Streptomyces sp. JJ66 TaxID=2803843 RepID=UPI001C58AE3C|nr:MarR family winged helix-turn-helix transcriptional regulator [Streptomyces sp. JJ66]MBW1601118.1 winged helix-turn-helix transcriptional regulator [Streptomyces sp. JJ66]